jgi:hypothetical protein
MFPLFPFFSQLPLLIYFYFLLVLLLLYSIIIIIKIQKKRRTTILKHCALFPHYFFFYYLLLLLLYFTYYLIYKIKKKLKQNTIFSFQTKNSILYTLEILSSRRSWTNNLQANFFFNELNAQSFFSSGFRAMT